MHKKIFSEYAYIFAEVSNKINVRAKIHLNKEENLKIR